MEVVLKIQVKPEGLPPFGAKFALKSLEEGGFS
jgi:hypothetical protein